MKGPLFGLYSRKARYSELSLPTAQSLPFRIEEHLSRPSEHVIDLKAALNWRVLAVLNLYRLLVPLMLLGLYSLGGAKGFLESQDLFFWAGAFYLCFGLASVILVRRRLVNAG